MNYKIIGSSSKGNAIVVENVLLLDCGLSYAKIKSYLKDIKLIFISHCHQDHLNKTTIKHIAFNYPTIKFITGSRVVVERLLECRVITKNIYFLEKSYRTYDMGMLGVMIEPLVHDTPNYALHFYINKKSGLYIVDTASVDHIQAKNYDLYLIENNYQEDLLKEHIDNCEDENMLCYLNRVPLTHLSSEQANSFLIENMGKNSVYEYIHKSDYNYKEVD